MLLPANLLSINFNTSILQSKANFFVAIKSVVFRNPLSLFIIDWLDIHKKVLLVFLRSSEQNISNDLSKCPYLKFVTWFGFEYLGCKNLHEWLSCNFIEELFRTSISHNSYKNFWKQWTDRISDETTENHR